VVRLATGRASYTALEYYFAENHRAGRGIVDVRAPGNGQRRARGVGRQVPGGRPVPTNRTAARCGSSHARLTATAAEILDVQPEHELDLGLERYLTPAELLADPRRRRSVAARQTAAGVLADDRLARLAGSRARLWVSFVRPRSAAELRRARGGRRRAAGLGRAWIPTTGRCPSRNAFELLVAELATRRPLIKDDAELSELARKELDIVAAGARAVEVFRAAGGAQLHHLDVSIGFPTCLKRRSCSRRRDFWMRRRLSRTLPSAIVPLFETIRRPAARLVDSRSGAGSSALTAPLWMQRAQKPGSDARLLGLQQGRRVPGGQLGAVPRRARPGRVRAQDRNPVCGSSTVAGGNRSGVAVAPAMTQSWRNRLGAVERGRCGSPSRARWIAAKYAEPRYRAPQPRDARRGHGSRPPCSTWRGWATPRGLRMRCLTSWPPGAQRAYAELVHETPGFRRVLQGLHAGQ